MKRLFIAVPIREGTRTQIVRGIFSDPFIKKLPVRWTAYQNLHLTLQFLGDVEEKRIPELKKIMDTLSFPEKADDLMFTGLGTFPEKAAPKILWLGIADHKPLRRLQRELTDLLTRAGFEADRKAFKPHLTLGRVKNEAQIPAAALDRLRELIAGQQFSPSPIDRITLFESRLQPAGPVYSAVYEKGFRERSSGVHTNPE